MKTVLRAIFVITLVLLFNCCEDDRVGSTISTIRYYYDDVLGFEKFFTYDETGRITQLKHYDKVNPGTGPLIEEIFYEENRIAVDGPATDLYFEFENNKLVSFTLHQEFSEEEMDVDVMNFYYDGENLVGFTFDNESYSIETDSQGNITRISGNGIDDYFEFDNKPNPLQGIPSLLFSISFITHNRYLNIQNVMYYFNRNNIKGNGYSCKYNVGRVSEMIYNDGSNTFTQKIRYKN